MSEDDQSNPLRTEKVVLADGNEYGVPAAMIPGARTILINFKNMDIVPEDDQNPLHRRYRHRVGNFANLLIANAFMSPDAKDQERRMQERLRELVKEDSKIKPLIDMLTADLLNEA